MFITGISPTNPPVMANRDQTSGIPFGTGASALPDVYYITIDHFFPTLWSILSLYTALYMHINTRAGTVEMPV